MLVNSKSKYVSNLPLKYLQKDYKKFSKKSFDSIVDSRKSGDSHNSEQLREDQIVNTFNTGNLTIVKKLKDSTIARVLCQHIMGIIQGRWNWVCKVCNYTSTFGFLHSERPGFIPKIWIFISICTPTIYLLPLPLPFRM